MSDTMLCTCTYYSISCVRYTYCLRRLSLQVSIITETCEDDTVTGAFTTVTVTYYTKTEDDRGGI